MRTRGKSKPKPLGCMDILRLSAVHPDLIRMAICPVCHTPMESVYCGSSGQEFWCVTSGCNAGFKYDLNGDFDSIVITPANWTGETA